MKGWVAVDAHGRSFVVRAGSGTVTAVAPIGIPDADGGVALHRIEIAVTADPGRPRAVRVSVNAQVPADSPLIAVAQAAEGSSLELAWEVEWHRLEWVPADLPITSLDLATDTTAVLTALAPVSVPAQALDAELALLLEQSGER